MTIDEYLNDFIDKLEFSLRNVPYELSKIDRYLKRLPWEYSIPDKHAYTFEAVVWI